MQISITSESVTSQIKPITKATTLDWGNAFKRLVHLVVPVVAFMYVLGGYLRSLISTPNRALKLLADDVSAIYRSAAAWLSTDPMGAVLPNEPQLADAAVVTQAKAATPTKTKRTRTRRRTAKSSTAD